MSDICVLNIHILNIIAIQENVNMPNYCNCKVHTYHVDIYQVYLTKAPANEHRDENVSMKENAQFIIFPKRFQECFLTVSTHNI